MSMRYLCIIEECHLFFNGSYISFMITKIISMPEKGKKPILSRLMIITLIEAYAKQNHGIPFGPVDIRGGSFGALIKRDLVTYEEVTIKNHKQFMWQVTPEGINILKAMGIDVD